MRRSRLAFAFASWVALGAGGANPKPVPPLFQVEHVAKGDPPAEIAAKIGDEIATLAEQLRDANPDEQARIQRRIDARKERLDGARPSILCGILWRPPGGQIDPLVIRLDDEQRRASARVKCGDFLEILEEPQPSGESAYGIPLHVVSEVRPSRRSDQWPDTEMMPRPWDEPDAKLAAHGIIVGGITTPVMPPPPIRAPSVQTATGRLKVGTGPARHQMTVTMRNTSEQRIAVLRGWIEFRDDRDVLVWTYRSLVILDLPRNAERAITLSLGSDTDIAGLSAPGVSGKVSASYLRIASAPP